MLIMMTEIMHSYKIQKHIYILGMQKYSDYVGQYKPALVLNEMRL